MTVEQIASIETALTGLGWCFEQIGRFRYFNNGERTISTGEQILVWNSWDPEVEKSREPVNLLDPIWRTALQAIDAALTAPAGEGE